MSTEVICELLFRRYEHLSVHKFCNKNTNSSDEQILLILVALKFSIQDFNEELWCFTI